MNVNRTNNQNYPYPQINELTTRSLKVSCYYIELILILY